MPKLTKNDWKGLWAVLWHVAVLVPVLWVFGLVLLVLVLGAFAVPPIYAAFAFLTGDWLFGIVALFFWLVVLRFRRPILRWTFDGIEYAGI